ncbi:hypothetical protein [Halorubrum laminariae]|uniref:Uncharacterized protein n=1 Tax=Halorubrum laminariae TaxID=1433523 RepID=A0ABD6BW07_9EURY|nr:hypothetical protein [Halorubrum laminariae]
MRPGITRRFRMPRFLSTARDAIAEMRAAVADGRDSDRADDGR